MIEQNSVLKALNTSGQPQPDAENSGERQLLPKLNGSFAEVLNRAAEMSDRVSETGRRSVSDIQVNSTELVTKTGEMIASMMANEANEANETSEKDSFHTAAAFINDNTETDLELVMKQIQLPHEKLTTTPSDTMTTVSSIKMVMEEAVLEESDNLPGLATFNADEDAVDIVSEDLQDVLTAADVTDMNESLSQAEVNITNDLAQTAGASMQTNKSLQPENLNIENAVDSTLEEARLSQTQEIVSVGVEGDMDENRDSEEEAVLPDDAINAQIDADMLTKATSQMNESRPPAGTEEGQNAFSNSASANNASQVLSQAAESGLKDAGQDKERSSLSTYANQTKPETAMGKEAGDTRMHKTDAGTSASAQQSSASSQSNQQGQQSFSGQQQAQQQFMNQVQKQVMQTQQEAVKVANEASVRDAETTEKAEKVLGGLGVGMDVKKTSGLTLSIGQPVRSSQWGQALGQKVTYMANNKIQEAKITLNPEKLGPIQVKLSMDKDQNAHVSMVTQHGTTREAIENAMPRLKEMLEAAGVGLGSMDVRDESAFADQNFANQDEQSTQAGRSSGTSGEDSEADMVEGSVQTVSSDNIVDFYA